MMPCIRFSFFFLFLRLDFIRGKEEEGYSQFGVCLCPTSIGISYWIFNLQETPVS